MAFANANIPMVDCYVRNEFLYNQEKGQGEHTKAWIFGVRSMKGAALQFYALLETGAMFTGLPLNAFCTDKEAPRWSLGIHQLWDNLSPVISITEFSLLRNMDCTVFLKNKTKEQGIYLFSIDYCDENPEVYHSLASTPNEWKSAHIIELYNGNLVAYPPNRILFKDASIVNPEADASKMGYKINTHYWTCEDGNKFSVGNEDEFLYGTKEDD